MSDWSGYWQGDVPLPEKFGWYGLTNNPIIDEERARMADFKWTGIGFDPTFEPEGLALDFKSDGFLKMNEVTVALNGVFTRDGQLVGLAVDAADGRALMLPLVEIPRSARTLMGTGKTLGESLADD